MQEYDDLVDDMLMSDLEPLHELLSRSDIVECSINADGNVFIKVAGNPRMIRQDNRYQLDSITILSIARTCTGQSNGKLTADFPLSTGTFKYKTETMDHVKTIRFQAIVSPALYGGEAAISFRVYSPINGRKNFKFNRLRDLSKPLEADINTQAKTLKKMAIDPNLDFDIFLKELVLSKFNVLISGSTDSGKSEFTRRYLSFVPDKDRIITIESGVELFPSQPNLLMFASSNDEGSQRTADDLLRASMRLNPNRIVVGEILGKEAETFMKVINSGHDGSLTTIHASSPKLAFNKLASLVRATGARIDNHEVIENLKYSIHVVIQLMEDQSTGERGVADIWFPLLDD